MDWTVYERRVNLVQRMCMDNQDLADYCLECALDAVGKRSEGDYQHDGLWLHHRKLDYLKLRRVQREESWEIRKEEGEEPRIIEETPEERVIRQDEDAEFWRRLGEGVDVLVDTRSKQTKETRRDTIKRIARLLVTGMEYQEAAAQVGVNKMAASRAVGVLRAVLVC